MKNQLLSLAAAALAVTFLPAVPVYIHGGAADKQPAFPQTSESGAVPQASAPSEPSMTDFSGTPYKVLDVSTGEIIEVSELEYVIGAVCAEMPASFGDEALKAQAVAAHTYAERQRLHEKSSPTEELMGADFSNDTSKYQGYFTKSQAQQFFGESFDESYTKISAAVGEVLPYMMTYNDEPIIAAFHSMSTGKTESAENAWGSAVEYLVPVDSSADTSAPKFIDEVRFNKEVLEHKLTTAFPDITLGGDISQWLSVLTVSDSGTVLTASAGGKTVSGNDIRTALSLRSACFDVRCEGDEAVITTRGYGHCVGMSQYGANAMAADGKTWQEILSHYYPGCTITKQE